MTQAHNLEHYQSLQGTSKVEAVHSVLDRTFYGTHGICVKVFDAGGGGCWRTQPSPGAGSIFCHGSTCISSISHPTTSCHGSAALNAQKRNSQEKDICKLVERYADAVLYDLEAAGSGEEGSRCHPSKGILGKYLTPTSSSSAAIT